MDPSQDFVHDADECITLFPDFRLLDVVRDPQAQVAPMNPAIIPDVDTPLNAMTGLTTYTEARALAPTQAWEQLAQKNFRADDLARVRKTLEARIQLESVS